MAGFMVYYCIRINFYNAWDYHWYTSAAGNSYLKLILIYLILYFDAASHSLPYYIILRIQAISSI